MRVEDHTLTPRMKILCAFCSLVVGVPNTVISQGQILSARYFDWHPEFPPFVDGEETLCRKCGRGICPAAFKLSFLVQDF